MPITADLLKKTRALNRPAVEQVLREFYPTVHRMAHALTGRPDVGRAVVTIVMAQGLKVMSKWSVEGAPERWFYHHTVLTSRRGRKQRPDAKNDVLVSSVPNATPEYVAYARAIRALPMQQREAYLLHAGEHFDERQLGIAMDLSRDAAANHLTAARAAITAIAGDNADAFARTLATAYAGLSPAEPLVLSDVRRYIRRHAWPRRLWRLTKLLLTLTLLAAIAWAIWWLRGNYEF